jgi:tRNA1(Val) A37 N6-methylase TrmN6
MVNDDLYTLDSIWNENKIKIRQPARGYRFALDAVLLAHFLRIEKNEEGLEIGTGSGIVSILLSRLQEFQRIITLEIQPELAKLAQENFLANTIANAQVIQIDVQNFVKNYSDSRFDLIFSNPPYRKEGSGRLNPSQQKAIARHEIQMKLEDLFICAQKLLKPKGRMSVILPEFREKDFSQLVEQYQLHWIEKRYVHSFEREKAALFLATISAFPVEMIQQRSLVIYDAPGVYSPELKRMLKEEVSHG